MAKVKLLNLVAGAGTLLAIARTFLTTPKKVNAERRETGARGESDHAERVKKSAPSVVLVRPEAERPKAQRGGHTSRDKTQQSKRPRWTYARLQTLYTAVIAFAAVATWAVSYYQWQALNMQTELLSKTLTETQTTREVENRAYVGVRGARLDKEPQDGETSLATAQITNTGNTPAMKVEYVLRIRYIRGQLTGPFLEGRLSELPLHNLGVLTPNGQARLLTNSRPLPVGMVQALKDGEIRLIAYGKVEYDDVFGRHRRTLLCFVYIPGQGVDLEPCEAGNTLE